MHMSHRAVRHYMLIKQHCIALLKYICIYFQNARWIVNVRRDVPVGVPLELSTCNGVARVTEV